MEVKRYTMGITEDYGKLQLLVIECEDGQYVTYEDYAYLSDYCDRLVEVGKLPCLPKDLENLREANAKFAQEIEDYKSIINDLYHQLDDKDDKLQSMVDEKEIMEGQINELEKAYDTIRKLRDHWHNKWQTAKHDSIEKVDAIKKQLDQIVNKI